MNPPYLVPLESCGDRALCGGKAEGLAKLLRRGLPVPPGVCLTTRSYVDTLQASRWNPADAWEQLKQTSESDRERILEQYRSHIASLTIPAHILDPLEIALENIEQAFASPREVVWAVRSSATNEDDREGSCAGLYRTRLGVGRAATPAAIKECWVSLWTTTAWTYQEFRVKHRHAPAMAVIVQTLLSPRAAGVAYSNHPVTGQPDRLVINAVLGLGEPLVSGTAASDSYIVCTTGPAHVVERHIVAKTTARRLACGVVQDIQVPRPEQERSALSEEEALALSRLIKSVERAMNHPVDVEWALDERQTWLLQARPIPEPSPKAGHDILTEAACSWSRANFKETLPDQPSTLGLSFLQEFMERNILRHYLDLGCFMPPGISSVRIIHGRPYINVSLFQSFMAQLGGDPAMVAEQMGGEAPWAPRASRLPWWQLLKAGIMMTWKIRQAARRAPRWLGEMKRIAQNQEDEATDACSPAELLVRLDRLGGRLASCDLTFAIVAGVSQSFYALQRMLERRVGDNWRAVLNASLQGSGNVISARQILWLAELAEGAMLEEPSAKFFASERWEPKDFRAKLAGTRFLHAFDEFLAEYGHRAVEESDVMSSRFAEAPDHLLGLIRGHLTGSSCVTAREIRTGQFAAREKALQRIRTALGWRYHEWAYFLWWHKRLTCFLSLREANRHYLMHITAALRHLILMMGRRFASHSVLGRPDDIFFLTHDEIRTLVARESEKLKALPAIRRAERVWNAAQPAPDFVTGQGETALPNAAHSASAGHALKGLSLSSGVVTGPVRLVHSTADFRRVQRGDIVVSAVIDPGMASLFGLAGGLIAEMGGVLSHGAIIAREYGIPAVANIQSIRDLLKDGQCIRLDADHGVVTICEFNSL